MGLGDLFYSIIPMSKKTQVGKFLVKYRPPDDFYKYARKYKTLDSLWQNCKRSDWMLWMMSCIEYKPACALRQFAVYSARQHVNLMADARSLKVIQVAEQFAIGEANTPELDEARKQAYAALTEAKRKNDKLAEALAWSAASTAKEDAFTAATDSATYAAEIADMRGGKNDFYRIRELQSHKLRQLAGNPFSND